MSRIFSIYMLYIRDVSYAHGSFLLPDTFRCHP
jgi:hypothetical protein